MAGVIVPAAKQKDDPLTTVMKGLAIARDVYGIKTEMDKSAAASQAKKDEAKGLVTPTQVAELQKTHDVSDKETPGSTKLFIRTPEGQESPIWASIREKGSPFRAPTQVINVVRSGKKGTLLRHNDGSGKEEFIETVPDKPAEDKAPAQTADLRKEYNSQKTTQNTYQVVEGYNKIMTAAQAKDPSPTDDMSLIFGFMKMQDPGSTVREGEYASAENTRGIPDTVLNAYNKAVDGQKLTPEQRGNFVRSAEGILDSQLKAQETVDKRYSDIATKFKVDPSYVVDSSFSGSRQTRQMDRDNKERDTLTKGPPASGAPSVGDEVDGYVFQGGDPSKQENWVQRREKPTSIGTAESILSVKRPPSIGTVESILRRP